MTKITCISDTHGLHNKLTNQLIGGDILICAGDVMKSGYYEQELIEFCKWFDSINNYDHKIFIAGNHDRLFENTPDTAMQIVNSYKTITYLQDDYTICDGIKIYGSPWQPEFLNWAFNLPRNGNKLKSKWDAIPNDTDILITHGPVFGYLDVVDNRTDHLGCELLANKIENLKLKLHVCGHIHTGHGIVYKDINGHKIRMINASVLNERYEQVFKPITINL